MCLELESQSRVASKLLTVALVMTALLWTVGCGSSTSVPISQSSGSGSGSGSSGGSGSGGSSNGNGTQAKSPVQVRLGDAPSDLVTSVPLYAVVGRKNVFLARILADGPETTFHLTAPAGTRSVLIDPNGTILTGNK